MVRSNTLHDQPLEFEFNLSSRLYRASTIMDERMGAGFEIPRGYIYFAMAFSVSVEMLNIRLRKKAAKPLHLHPTMNIDGDSA